jgi:hypothetical protein
MSEYKILLVENQQSQFEKIHYRFNDYNNSNVSDRFRVFPDSNNFLMFIDCVRVFVNTNYGMYGNYIENNLTYREFAMSKIINEIDTNGIGLILMDYKLGAGYRCKSGIFLAEQINKLRETKNKPYLPVVFISKDLKNKKIDDELREYNYQYEWVHKGYFGDEILNEEYFNNNVIDAINRCFGKTREQKIRDHIKDVILLWYLNNGQPPGLGHQARKQYDIFERLRDKKEFSESLEQYIYGLNARSDVITKDLEKKCNE